MATRRYKEFKGAPQIFRDASVIGRGGRVATHPRGVLATVLALYHRAHGPRHRTGLPFQVAPIVISGATYCGIKQGVVSLRVWHSMTPKTKKDTGPRKGRWCPPLDCLYTKDDLDKNQQLFLCLSRP
jgi:hypothetical protein